MHLYEQEIDGLVVITVQGDVDHSNGHLLKERLTAHLDRERLVLDLRACSYVDSAGLSAIVEFLQASDRTHMLATLVSEPRMEKLFSVVGLDQLPNFRVFADTGSAATALGLAAWPAAAG